MQYTIIVLDVAKNVFQVRGVGSVGGTLVRRRLRRAEVLPFFEGPADATAVCPALCEAEQNDATDAEPIWLRLLVGDHGDRCWDVCHELTRRMT